VPTHASGERRVERSRPLQHWTAAAHARRSKPTADELEAVYRAHVASIHGFFSYSVGRDLAEDLTAATFERVVRSWGRFDASRSGERTWIYAIARNLLTDHLRRQRHRSGPSLDEHPALLDGIASSEDPAQRTLDADAVSAWLRELPPRAREVLALRYCADYSVAEIARIMGLTEANVHQICSRALRQLRSAVADGRAPSTFRHRAVSDSGSHVGARARACNGSTAGNRDRP
jgi:RNA polymerase sigma-70 factor (ECF subfamily)